MSFYLDTSVVVPQFLDEVESENARCWTRDSDKPLFVSQLVIGEFNASISRRVREGELDVMQAAKLITDCTDWTGRMTHLVALADEDVADAAELVRTPFPKLLMPDAIHLALCKRLDLTLATFDKDLLTIAAREGVPALRPE